MSTEKSLFLHSCCAPCSSVALERLAEHYDVVLYYYNPNITPFEEYEKRLSEQKRLCTLLGIPLIEGDYNHDEFLKAARGLENETEGGERCRRCIETRLFKTAEVAAARGSNYFAATLSVSPHKNAQMINTILKEAGERYKILPLFEDFKKKDGFKRSLELSKQYGLYRQSYCGCGFSQKSRKC